MLQNKVSVRRAIDMARRKLDIESLGSLESDFVEWVFEGELKIGSTLTFERQECYVTIENHQGCLPPGFLYLLGIEYHGRRLEPSQADFQLFGKKPAVGGVNAPLAMPVDGRVFLNSLYGFFSGHSLKFSIHGNVLRMPTVKEGRVGIAYKGVCVDEEGYPLVNDLHTDALSQYLVYMHTEREYLRGRVPAHVYDRMKQRWLELCAQARSEDETPSPQDMAVLAAVWNNMLPLPSLNNF